MCTSIVHEHLEVIFPFFVCVSHPEDKSQSRQELRLAFFQFISMRQFPLSVTPVAVSRVGEGTIQRNTKYQIRQKFLAMTYSNSFRRALPFAQLLISDLLSLQLTMATVEVSRGGGDAGRLC